MSSANYRQPTYPPKPHGSPQASYPPPRAHGGASFGSSASSSSTRVPTNEPIKWLYSNPVDIVDGHVKPVPEQNNTLLIPGFSKLSGVEPEDKLTSEQIEAGYKAPYFVNHEREYASFRTMVPDNLKMLGPLILSRIQEVAIARKTKAKQMKAKQERLKVVVGELFPSLNVNLINKKDEFLKGLADSKLRLMRLRSKVGLPMAFNQLSTLMDAYVTERVPLPRGVWFLKIVFLQRLYKQADGTLKDRQNTASADYTKNVMDLLKERLNDLFSMNQAKKPPQGKVSGGGGVSASAQDEKLVALNYICRFIQWTFHENLIDRPLMFTALLDLVSDKMTQADAYVLEFLELFAKEICASPLHLQKLIGLCLSLANKLNQMNSTEPAQSTNAFFMRESFSVLCRAFVRHAPQVFVLLDEAAFDVAWKLVDQMPQQILMDRNRLKSPVSLPSSVDRVAILAQLTQFSLASRPDFDTLWKSIFKYAVFEHHHTHSTSLAEVVGLLCEWSCWDTDHLPPYRRYLVAALLKITNAYMKSLLRVTESNRRRSKNSPDCYPLQQKLIAFLDIFLPKNDQEYTNLARLFSELIREDIFSHVLYGRQLIAREILKRPALDEFGKRHRRYYATFPLFGKLEEERSDRSYYLYGLNSSPDKEEYEKGLLYVHSVFPPPTPGSNFVPRVVLSELPVAISFVEHCSSVYVQEMLIEYLFNWCVNAIRGLQTDLASIRSFTVPVLLVMEVAEDYHSLTSLLLWVIHNRSVPELFVLDYIQFFEYVFFCNRKVLPLLAGLHSKIDGKVGSLSEIVKSRLLTVVAKSLKSLDYLPELQNWQQKVVILDTSLKQKLKELVMLNPAKVEVVEPPEAMRGQFAATFARYFSTSAILSNEAFRDLASKFNLGTERKIIATSMLALLGAMKDVVSATVGHDSTERRPTLMNMWNLFAMLKESVPLLYSISEVPLAVVRQFVLSSLNKKCSDSEMAGVVCIVQLMLLKSIIGVAEFFSQVLPLLLKVDLASSPFPENYMVWLKLLFGEKPDFSTSGLSTLAHTRLSMASLDLTMIFPLIDSLYQLSKKRPASPNLQQALGAFNLAKSWLLSFFCKDCTALYERFKNYKDPAGVRSLFHHLFLGETVAPVTKDDSSSTGVPLMLKTMVEVNELGLMQSWMILRLLLDEWFYNTNDLKSVTNVPVAVQAFADAFVFCVTKAKSSFAVKSADAMDVDLAESYEKEKESAGFVKSLPTFSTNDYRFEALVRYLAGNLDCQAGILTALRVLFDTPEFINRTQPLCEVVKRNVASTVSSLGSIELKMSDADIEDALLLLLSTASPALESSKSGIEDAFKRQLDSLKEALASLKSNVSAPKLPKLIATLRFITKCISCLANDLLVSKAPAVVSKRDEISKLLLSILRIPIVAVYDLSLFNYMVEVFGLLVSPDSDRFTMAPQNYTKVDRPQIRRQLADILQTAAPNEPMLAPELRLRIEQLMPPIALKITQQKLPDPANATFDNIDPWILLEESESPILFNKIEKDEKEIPKRLSSFINTFEPVKVPQPKAAGLSPNSQAFNAPTPKPMKLETPNNPLTPSLLTPGGGFDLSRGLEIQNPSPYLSPPTKPRGEMDIETATPMRTPLSVPLYSRNPTPIKGAPTRSVSGAGQMHPSTAVYRPSQPTSSLSTYPPPPRPPATATVGQLKRPPSNEALAHQSPAKKPRTEYQ